MKPVGLSLLWILLLLGQFTFLYYLWGTVPELHEEGSITVHTNNQRNFVENFPGEPPVRIEEIIKIEEVIKYVPVENVDESECIFTDEYQKTIQKLMEKIQESHASIKYLSQKLEKQQIPQIPVGGGVKKSVENFGENPNKNIIKISTFNIWNVNQPWQRRMEELVKIIRSKNIEILGLQEVRTTKRSSLQLIQPINTSLDGLKINNTLEITNISDIQLHFIQSLLPDFKWSVYMPTANMPDGAQEGIAILSKYPILEVTGTDVTVRGYSDLNTRGLLKAKIEYDSTTQFELYNAHFPYDDMQQCPTVTKLYDLFESSFHSNKLPQLVIGDLNTYLTFEWPIDFLIDDFSYLTVSPSNPCSPVFSKWLSEKNISISSPLELPNNGYSSAYPRFVDVWKRAFPRTPTGKLKNSNVQQEIQALGHTFPVFKSSILDNCRPDRMLLRSHPDSFAFNIISVETFGGDAIPAASGPLYISDHLGIIVELGF